jgi:hypothetical protein
VGVDQTDAEARVARSALTVALPGGSTLLLQLLAEWVGST